MYTILFLFLENHVLSFWVILKRMDGVFVILFLSLFPLYIFCCGIYLYFSFSIR